MHIRIFLQEYLNVTDKFGNSVMHQTKGIAAFYLIWYGMANLTISNGLTITSV
jgi:hypothetical protein